MNDDRYEYVSIPGASRAIRDNETGLVAAFADDHSIVDLEIMALRLNEGTREPGSIPCWETPEYWGS